MKAIDTTAEAQGRMSRPINAVRILIVEDDDNFAAVASTLIQPIMRAFPGSSVLHVKTIEAMLAAVAEIAAPDITLLDLSLPPSGIRETLAHLDALEERTAVVIITGHSREEVRAIIGQRATPIVEKSPALIEQPGLLLAAIYMAVEVFQNHRWAKWRSNLKILKGVTSHPATSTGPPDASTE